MQGESQWTEKAGGGGSHGIEKRAAETRQQEGPGAWIMQAALVLLGLGGIVTVLLCTSRYGVGTFADAENYIAAARSLLAGEGYRCYYGVPYTQWPPLFPTLLAAIGLAGVDPQIGARWLNALAFGLIIFFSGQLFMRYTTSRWLVMGGTLTVLASRPLLDWSMLAASEPIFVVLTILFALCLLRFLRTQSRPRLVLAAMVAALACLERYAGVSLVLAGAILVAVATPGTRLLRRLEHAVVFGVVSLLPLALWCVRNRMVAGETVGYHRLRIISVHDLVAPFQAAARVMAVWFFPWTKAEGREAIDLGLIIVLALALILVSRVVRAGRRRSTSDAVRDLARDGAAGASLLSMAFIAVTYFGFIVVCGAGLDWLPRQRHMEPLFAFLVALVIVACDETRRWRIAGRGQVKQVGALAVVLFALWLQAPFRDLFQNVKSCMKNGAGGYTVFTWQDSPLVAWLREHPLPGRGYCNISDGLYLLTRAVTSLPPRWQHASGLVDFARTSASEKPYVIWFNGVVYPGLFDLRELRSCCRMEEVVKFPDGCVYQCLGAGGPPISAVYRFVSLKTGRHFYTTDKRRRDDLRKSPSSLWKYESLPFYVFAQSQPGTRPVYHLWSERLDTHFYTMDEAEKDKLLQDPPHTWTSGDIAFYAYPDGAKEELTPVYRLLSQKSGDYLYTAGERERAKLFKENSGRWIDQGVAWYAYGP